MELNQQEKEEIDRIKALHRQHQYAADFIAVITYKTKSEGGRVNPVWSGYRAQVKFPFDEMQTSGQQIFIDRDIVFPGEPAEAEVRILSVEYFFGKLYEQLEFEISEGARIVGTGRIVSITNEKLLLKN